MASQMVRVKRKVLESCMTCPLCNKLLKEATTISLCLHTFCRKCIYEKLSSEEVDSCPVCGVDLGCLPVEKLRPDHNLQDTRAKIFPLQKRKINPPEVSPSISLPVKRKERSLSSLVVNTPEVLMQTGLTGPQFQGSLISTLPTYSDFLPPTTEGFHDQNFLLNPPEVHGPALPHLTAPPVQKSSPNPQTYQRRLSISEDLLTELRTCIESLGTVLSSVEDRMNAFFVDLSKDIYLVQDRLASKMDKFEDSLSRALRSIRSDIQALKPEQHSPMCFSGVFSADFLPPIFRPEVVEEVHLMPLDIHDAEFKFIDPFVSSATKSPSEPPHPPADPPVEPPPCMALVVYRGPFPFSAPSASHAVGPMIVPHAYMNYAVPPSIRKELWKRILAGVSKKAENRKTEPEPSVWFSSARF